MGMTLEICKAVYISEKKTSMCRFLEVDRPRAIHSWIFRKIIKAKNRFNDYHYLEYDDLIDIKEMCKRLLDSNSLDELIKEYRRDGYKMKITNFDKEIYYKKIKYIFKQMSKIKDNEEYYYHYF